MFNFNFKRKYTTKDLVTASLLCALSIVLTRFGDIGNETFRISFGFVPILICGVLQGPFMAGMTGAVADVLGIIIDGGNMHLGFTLSAYITGFIFGLFLYQKEKNIFLITLALLLNMIITSFLLNTLWIHMLYGTEFLVLLKTRIPLNFGVFLIRIPLTYVIFDYIINPIRKLSGINNA